MVSDDRYAWQEEVFGHWRDNGFKGVVKAVVSAGKTKGGVKTIITYQKYFPYDRIWIIANSKEVLKQWQIEVRSANIEGIEFFTYTSAYNRMRKLESEGKEKQLPDMMVLDECQAVCTPCWGRVMDFGVERYIGLSATPNGAERILGGIIQTVNWESANIADTNAYMLKFKPTEEEMALYRKRSNTIDKYKESHPHSNYKNDLRLQMFYNGRRMVVNKFKSRYDHAINLIKKYDGHDIMVFCQYHEQAEELSSRLDDLEIPHAIHISGKEHLEDFISGKVHVCISCKKLTTGFSYPPADTAIVVATATSPLTATQTLGRVIRPDPNNPDKKARVIFLLADNTNDLALIDNKIYLKDKTYVDSIENFMSGKYD